MGLFKVSVLPPLATPVRRLQLVPVLAGLHSFAGTFRITLTGGLIDGALGSIEVERAAKGNGQADSPK